MRTLIRKSAGRLQIGYHGGGMFFWRYEQEGEISVFLGKRKHGVDRGRWSLPGGGWERQDGFSSEGRRNYHTTALRESQEETGYAVPPEDGVTRIWAIHVPFFHYEVFDYRIKEMDVQLSADHSEFSEGAWFPISSLPEPLEWFIPLQMQSLKKKLIRKERLRDVVLI